MKKIHMTKLLISAWMLMFGLAVQAQVYTEFNMTGKRPVGVQYTQPGMDLNKMDKHQYGNMTVYSPKQQFQASKKAEPGEVTLTFNLVYDPEVFMPTSQGVTIINKNYKKNAWYQGEDIITATVSPGIYDFAACFLSMEKGDNYWVIYEQVEVTGDATFTLSTEEATNHISFINYGPDGNVLKHALLGGFDEETWEPIILEEGDVEVTSIGYSVYLKGVGFVSSSLSTISGPWPEELRTAPFFEYYVNDVSDRYVFTQSRICNNGPEVWYLNYFSTDDVHAGIIENNPADYVLCQENYQFSSHGQGEIGYGAGITVYSFKNGILLNQGTITCGGITTKQGEVYSIDVYNSIPFENPNDEGLNLLVGNEFIDYYGLFYDPWGEYYDVMGKTKTTPYAIEDRQQVFHNIGHFNKIGNTSGKTAVLTENGIKHQLLPAPAAFTYPAEERLGAVGDNCPINSVNLLSYYDEYQGDAMSFGNNYVGRYGESRHCDDAETSLTFKFNGEEIEDPDNWSRDSKGTWEFTVTNSNIVVDGLQGENKTVVYFDDTNEESTCPGIEMLHFRNEAGITDRFATAAEGTLEFMGGAFKYDYYPEIWNGVFGCQPMDVTVEYSPYGEENWQELVVEEVPELFQMPGWGYFYRASLADVTGKATQGWFDLRFMLQDEVGNWQEQVVSPAFRIDDLISTAVEEVAAATAVREVARYSVDGRQLSAPQPGLNIIMMSDGTSRKVWVK